MQQCFTGKTSSSAEHSSLPLVAVVQDEPAMFYLSIAKNSQKTFMRHLFAQGPLSACNTDGDCSDEAFNGKSVWRQE
eukprot:scaffold88728_cov20-Prasinocladus_malaysianus.AAC.1